MQIDFSKNSYGLVPAIITDADSGKVLMLGYMNQESLDKTIATKQVSFFSRSRQQLWTKGETSGNFLNLVEIKADCDNDTLLVYVRPQGAVCHTGMATCFGEKNEGKNDFLFYLENLIYDRKANPVENSYTNKLFNQGINKIAQKVGEEAVELVIEAKDENRELFLGEAADLFFHTLVLLAAKGVRLDEVIEVLRQRHK